MSDLSCKTLNCTCFKILKFPDIISSINTQRGPVKLIQTVKTAHSFLQVTSKLFHSIIYVCLGSSTSRCKRTFSRPFNNKGKIMIFCSYLSNVLVSVTQGCRLKSAILYEITGKTGKMVRNYWKTVFILIIFCEANFEPQNTNLQTIFRILFIQ